MEKTNIPFINISIKLEKFRAKNKNKPVTPVIVRQVIHEVLSENFDVLKCKSTSWEGLRIAADSLVWRKERDAVYAPHERTRVLIEASEAIHYVIYKYIGGKRNKPIRHNGWDWCPLCWRPVPGNTHRRPTLCRQHDIKQSDSEYHVIMRLIRKYYGKKTSLIKHLAHDYLPNKFKLISKHNTSSMRKIAFDNIHNNDIDIAIDIQCIPYVWKFIASQESSLDIECPPYALPILRALAGPDLLPDKMLNPEKIAMLTRAEAWLMFMATKPGRGGKRPGAGRPKKK